jgi:hypothetical protein
MLSRKSVKAGLSSAFGSIAAFPLFGMIYYTMLRTSTPQFCASRHEIEFADTPCNSGARASTNAVGREVGPLRYFLKISPAGCRQWPAWMLRPA